MIYLKLAWKNIWRNKRRTAITWASIFFAVLLAAVMTSVKEGVLDNMVKTGIGDFYGYAQIHSKGYWDDKTLDHSFQMTPELKEILGSKKDLKFLPRVESFALAASQEVTKGSLVMGLDPDLEAKYNGLKDRVSGGEYFRSDRKGVLIGAGLADYLKLGVNDTIVLLGSGYQGRTAAGKYPIDGILKFGSPEISKQLVFMRMEDAQNLYSVEGMINNIILLVEDGDAGISIARKLKNQVSEEYEVMDWMELNPEMVNIIETERVEGYVFIFILYLVISFGIFGTMLMMMAERRHEFGVLVAIGMKRLNLAIMLFMEVVIIAVMGAFLGIFGAYPIGLYYNLNPISIGGEMGEMYEEYGMEAVIQFSADPMLFLNQAIIIGVIASVIGIWPFIRMLRVQAIEEMRS